jgi:hypothetical protein
VVTNKTCRRTHEQSTFSDSLREYFLTSMATTEPIPTVPETAEPKADQEKLLIEPPSPQKLPTLFSSLSDSDLSQAVELGTAIKQFRERTTSQSMLSHLKRVAPTFQGQILDFNLDPKYTKLFTKECPEPMEDITIPRVKEADTVYARDVHEAKALDATMTEASNRLLCASTYMLDVLHNLKEESDPQLTEGLFRSFCLTSSATSMLEVERLLRPGDRPMVRDKIARIDIPTVIQEVRRSAPTAADPPYRVGVLSARTTDDTFPVKKKSTMDPPPEMLTETFRHQSGRRYNRRARPGFSHYGRGSYRGGSAQDNWARQSWGSAGGSGSSSASPSSSP